MIDYSKFKAGEFKEEVKEETEKDMLIKQPLMNFVTFKNLASEKARLLEGCVVKITDGLIGTSSSEEISNIISERSKLNDIYFSDDNPTSHTFINFLRFLYSSLELTSRMVFHLKTIVINPDNFKDMNAKPSESSDTWSPMNDILNNICILSVRIKGDLFSILEEFGSYSCETEEERRYDVKHTTGVLDYINNELYIILGHCIDIITTIYGDQSNDEVKCGCVCEE